MRVLIGGGSGFIGRALRTHLKRQGHETVTISRTKGPSKLTWDSIKTSGIPKCDAVINLAGERVFSSRRWTPEFLADMRSSRIDTNEILVKAITESSEPPAVWLSSSAIGYYTASTGKTFTEDDVCAASSDMQTLCRDWEASARLSSTRTRHVTLRIGIVLGKSDGFFSNIKFPFSFGLGGVIGSGKQAFPWIHQDDMVQLIEHAIANDHVKGILNAVAPDSTTNFAFTKAVGRAMCRPTIFWVPEFVVRSMLHRERAEMLLQVPNVVPKRTLELGYVFKYSDIESAIADLIS